MGLALANTGGGGDSLPGRMTGGGSIFAGSMRITHGMELNCDATQNPQNLQINWQGNRFHLQQLTSAFCSNDPYINPAPPEAGFNTFTGSGIGRLNGRAGATIDFTFTDAGEPGTSDTASYSIYNSSGALVLTGSGTLDKGNQQAHNP
jgi:hypothetical protein